MVLESLINPFKPKKNLWEIYFIGILYSTAALFLSNWIFTEHASLLMVFFTVMASIPLLYNTIKLDESREEKLFDRKTIFKEQGKVISLIFLLFMGFVT